MTRKSTGLKRDARILGIRYKKRVEIDVFDKKENARFRKSSREGRLTQQIEQARTMKHG